MRISLFSLGGLIDIMASASPRAINPLIHLGLIDEFAIKPSLPLIIPILEQNLFICFIKLEIKHINNINSGHVIKKSPLRTLETQTFITIYKIKGII